MKEQEPEYSTKARDTIYAALMQLMKQKSYDKITIKEITERAGVSRMAFYRNYVSKEHVLTHHLDKMFTEYFKEIMENPDHQISLIQERFFPYFRQHADFLQAVVKAGQDQLIYQQFEKYSKVLAGAVKIAALNYEITEYEVYFASAGLASMLIHWARNGMRDTDEDMAQILYRLSGIKE